MPDFSTWAGGQTYYELQPRVFFQILQESIVENTHPKPLLVTETPWTITDTEWPSANFRARVTCFSLGQNERIRLDANVYLFSSVRRFVPYTLGALGELPETG